MRPVYTFILTTRNDDHDQGLARLKTCLYALFRHMEYAAVPSELLMVEWNAPPDRPLLADVLEWPKGLKHWTVRTLTVPPCVHNVWSGRPHGAIKVYVLAARNAAILRAAGEWILPLNQDCYFSLALALFLGSYRLLQGKNYYRAIRADIDRNVPAPTCLADLLAYGRTHITKAHGGFGSGSGKGLFTNGSGDFMLMHREAWHRLRGYPELPRYGMSLDSIQVVMAHKAGYGQVIIPPPGYIYHIEHERGWTSSGYAGLRAMGYEFTSPGEYNEWAQRIQRGEEPYIFNARDWGLGGYDLPERQIDVR